MPDVYVIEDITPYEHAFIAIFRTQEEAEDALYRYLHDSEVHRDSRDYRVRGVQFGIHLLWQEAI